VSLRQLKWTTIVGPLLFLLAIDILRRTVLPELLEGWPGEILLAGIILFATLLFAETIFGRVERMQKRVEQQNRELLALHEAGLDVAGELSLDLVLQKVVDHARELIGARYGALSVPAPNGSIEAFITAGITPEQRALIGPPPVGHGLLSVVLNEGERLRLTDLTQHARSIGFPEHHPPMRSLLAVPIISGGRILGNLYLAEKESASSFSVDDEETLVRFATQAALAIDNARLHQRVRDLAITEERERIAREMHDSLAQVLGYVNAKAQAVQELLKADQIPRAEAQIGQLGEAARAAYADVREGILGLRTSLGPDRSLLDALHDYLEQWQEQSAIRAELRIEPADASLAGLSPIGELQLLRIVQEALANVRKHAAASQVRVCLTETADLVETVVEDNGRGFNTTDRVRAQDRAGPHFGLSTMRERAESVGGSIAIDSSPGQGTRVRVRMPARKDPRPTVPTEGLEKRPAD
jgi:nitrate/nitrite-specific signal transduction histidine kinase